MASVNALVLAASGKTTKHSSSPTILIYLIIIVGIGYFLLVRPQRQRARRQQQSSKDIGVGDEVMLTSGIVGRVVSLEGDRGRVEIADGVEIEVLRKAISQRLSSGGPAAEQDGADDEEEDDEDEDDIPPDPGAEHEDYDPLPDHHFDDSDLDDLGEGSANGNYRDGDDEDAGDGKATARRPSTGAANHVMARGRRRSRSQSPPVPKVPGRDPSVVKPGARPARGASARGASARGVEDNQSQDGRSRGD
ncbi:MAG: preprotein translocase subunit YajC [Acidimicrobiales bacterium]